MRALAWLQQGVDLLVDEGPDSAPMVEGQSGDVCGIAPHPTMANYYATACGDGSVYIWDSTLRGCVQQWQIIRGAETPTCDARNSSAISKHG